MNPDEQPQGMPSQPPVPPAVDSDAQTTSVEQLFSVEQEPSTGSAPDASSLHGPVGAMGSTVQSETIPAPIVPAEPEVSPAATALFGAPVANLGDASASTEVSDLAVPSEPEVSTGVIPSPVAKKPAGALIDSVKPVAKPETPAIGSPAATPSPVSGAIDSILESRDQSEKSDEKQKDIKLPSAKKKGKGLLVMLVSLLVLLVGAAGGWFFFVKTPADAAGTAYTTGAERYMQNVAQLLGDAVGNAEGAAVAIEALEKPVLEATLLSDFSFSDTYKKAQQLEKDVNNRVAGYVQTLRSYGDVAGLFAEYQTADQELQAILNRAMGETDQVALSAIYQEYVDAVEAISLKFEEANLGDDFDAIRTELVSAFDEETTAARAYIISADATPDEEAAATTEEDATETEAAEDTEAPTLNDAVNSRRIAADKISQYLASVSEVMTELADSARQYADSL